MKSSASQPLPVDQVSTDLRAFAAELRLRLEGRGEVSTPDTDGFGEGFTVRSAVEGTVEVWLMHDAEGIVVGLDRCPGWDLPRESGSVGTVEAIVEAAVGGSIEVGSGRAVRSYRVPMPDGTVMEDTAEGSVATLLALPWKPRLRWQSASPYS